MGSFGQNLYIFFSFSPWQLAFLIWRCTNTCLPIKICKALKCCVCIWPMILQWKINYLFIYAREYTVFSFLFLFLSVPFFFYLLNLFFYLLKYIFVKNHLQHVFQLLITFWMKTLIALNFNNADNKFFLALCFSLEETHSKKIRHLINITTI